MILTTIDSRHLTRAKRLIQDYLNWKAKDRSQRPSCNLELFEEWDCCTYHRQISDRNGVLVSRARNLTLNMELRGEVFSPNWWTDFAKHFPIEIPEILTTIK